MESPSIVLGVDLMDRDHLRLERLLDAVAHSRNEHLPRLHRELTDELDAHFAREEALMRRIAYREIAHHAAEHARVVVEGRRFAAQAIAGRTMMARAWTTDWVPDWYRRHVSMLDSEVARVAKAAGAA